MIQLGLRDNVLATYASEWNVQIEDISAFVAEQRMPIPTDRPVPSRSPWQQHGRTIEEAASLLIPGANCLKLL